MISEFGENVPLSPRPPPSASSNIGASHSMAHHPSTSSRVSRMSMSHQQQQQRRDKRASTGSTYDTPPATGLTHRTSLTAPIHEGITTLMRRMSSTHGAHGGHASPPASAGYHNTTMPTVGLITALPGAAHFSGGTSDIAAHTKFRPTFADGEDRTQLDPIRQQILNDTLQLFCARPTLEIFELHWRRDAIFEDPLRQCKGYKEYTAQWFSLPKVVSSSRTISHRVLASTSSPSRIVYSQTQEYTMRITKRKKVVQSMVVIHLDNNNKITMLEDKWKGDDQPRNWASRRV
ncbi:hypothetical protein DL93DRAFT_631388 [Clavulina sp. PMI_390]|nr:hypothetical protein DL93DRAFT_631388 [Clavulina sp. PMI_390]